MQKLADQQDNNMNLNINMSDNDTTASIALKDSESFFKIGADNNGEDN